MYIYICKFNNMNWKLYLKGYFYDNHTGNSVEWRI